MAAVTAVFGALGILTVGAPRPADAAEPAAIADPAAYPRRGVPDLKGLQPDFWPSPADNAPGLGTVSINFLWAEWEPSVQAPPCSPDRVEQGGHCFVVPPAVDAQVQAYSDLGAPATAILYGTPAWARGARACSPVAPGFEIFCVPDDPADFARFVALIAQRYDGAHGHGRVSDFVIQNEVNTNDWFDIGCGQGTACDVDDWVHTYAAIFVAAYDRVRAAQPRAHVLISLTHHFDPVFDTPALDHPALSVKTFIDSLVPLLGGRAWSVAIHPYPGLPTPAIDARDLPFVTLGNIGVLVGWLRATYPDVPSAWDVQMTEQGLNAPDASLEPQQAESLCQAFRAALGTPGVSSFVYHRLRDNANEFGLSLGLRRLDGSPKPAFTVWHDANDPARPTCGFENYPHTVVRHGVDAGGAHWYSSRPLPRGFTAQAGDAWTLSYEEVPGTAMLYECADGLVRSSYLTRDVHCPGGIPLGPVGAIATTSAEGTTALSLCREVAGVPGSGNLVTLAPSCPAGQREVLGFVAGLAPVTPPVATPSFTG